MNKVEELKFDSTLWATPAKLVNYVISYLILNRKN